MTAQEVAVSVHGLAVIAVLALVAWRALWRREG